MAGPEQRVRRRLDPERRREQLLAVAAEEFGRVGFLQASVAGIAELAGASEALVYRYFGSKDALYLEVVGRAVDSLERRRATAVEALPPGAPLRVRVEAAVHAYLDHVATHPLAWALPLRIPGAEPAEAAQLRARVRAGVAAELLRELGLPAGEGGGSGPDYAVRGFLGFLDAACLHWVGLGCPDAGRRPLVESVLGALAGALGEGVLGEGLPGDGAA